MQMRWSHDFIILLLVYVSELRLHLHPHRERGGGDYVWHLFDRLEDLRPILTAST